MQSCERQGGDDGDGAPACPACVLTVISTKEEEEEGEEDFVLLRKKLTRDGAPACPAGKLPEEEEEEQLEGEEEEEELIILRKKLFLRDRDSNVLQRVPTGSSAGLQRVTLTTLTTVVLWVKRLDQLQQAAIVEYLSELPAVEILCIHGLGIWPIWQPGALPRLRYMKMNSWPICQPGAMPCLKYVELAIRVRAFNDANFDYHDFYRLRCLPLLKRAQVAVICGGAKTEEVHEVEATLWRVVQHHPNHPTLLLRRNGQCVDDKQLEDSHGSRSVSRQSDVDDKQLYLQIHDNLHYSRVAPETMSLELLKQITKNFSKKRELGRGTFGTVYKGVHNGKKIAVKRLRPTQRSSNEEEFRKEYENLRRLNHPNIVQLLGYCYEIKYEFVQYQGKCVFAENIYSALCFDYMCKGSLREHLNDEFHGLEWQTRYKIIKGACEGLKYLHEGMGTPMYHLDLKPGNILLDKNMVPKLADFGLSKLVSDNHTQATSSFLGTIRYCPPEYIDKKLVSNKFDIFSLGVVMIEIIAGSEGYSKVAEMSSKEFIHHVQENWSKRLQETPGCKSLIYQCHQVKRCIEIALDCVSPDRMQRPDIGKITSMLNETENCSEELPLL